MPDALIKILSRELEELKQNKIRVGALSVCFLVLLVIWITDDGPDGEEIALEEEPPLTKDLPVKVLPSDKNPDGVKIVLGANADRLFIGDPFAGKEKEEPEPAPEPPIIPVVPEPILIQSPPPAVKIELPKEKVLLMGTAISGGNKTAMFLRGSQTLFLTIGEELDGRKISDITPDFVTLEDGERIFFQKEMR